MSRVMMRLLTLGLLLFGAGASQAHKASDAYLALRGSGSALELRLSLALKDIDAAVPLDGNGDGSLTWGELRARLPEVLAWIDGGVALLRSAPEAGSDTIGNRCALKWNFESLERRSDGSYLRAETRADCSADKVLNAAPARSGAGPVLDYRLMRGIDPTHRVIVAGTLQGRDVAGLIAPQTDTLLPLARLAGDTLGAAAVVGSRAAPATPGAASGGAGWRALTQFFPEGIHHLLTGYDHMAFVLALLLPLRLARRQTLPEGVTPPAAERAGLWMLVRTITGFTIGHSITLVLATLGVIQVSGNWVEPVIALTIGVSAALNLWPLPRLRTDALALGFGLIHGLGFSSVLAESGVSGSLLPWALAGFNLGVEAGQLIAVALWVALLLALGRWLDDARHARMVRLGSWALIALALYWLVTRLA